MGLPLLKEAFQAVQAASLPLEPDASESTGELLGMLARIATRSERNVAEWDNQASRLTRDIPHAVKEYLSSGGKPEEIASDLERLKMEVESRHDKIVALSDQAHMIFDQDNRSGYDFLFGDAELFISHARRMNALMDKDIAIGSELLDFLTITIADIDPDARGGPSFDNVDDLIAYLHGQIEA